MALVSDREVEEVALGRLEGVGPVAVIDIGSNSVRLVVYERLSRSPTPLFNEKELCGLGRGVAKNGVLDEQAVALTLATIHRFRALVRQLRVRMTHILATSAVREAKNGPEFVAAVEKIMGVKVALLTGVEEARLTALGVISGVMNPDGVAGDLGGGSLELVSIDRGAVGPGETFPLGGLQLEELAERSPKKAEKLAAEHLARSEELKTGAGKTFYAIGGTWRSLAQLHMRQKGHPLNVIHHYAIAASEAADFCRMVARQDTDSLGSIEAVSKARRLLLPYGAVVLGELIGAMKPASIVFSALGVREGLLFDLLDKPTRAKDPLIVAAEDLSLLNSRSPRHTAELVPWTAGVFGMLGIDETPDEGRLREAACLLADIGWRSHPDYRGSYSLNSIALGAFIGIDHPGRAFLALANYYRHEGLVDEDASPRIRELVSTRMMERARALGATLRVAYLISASMPGVVPRTRIETRGEALALVLPRDLGALAGARVLRRLGSLAKLAGRRPEIVVEG